MNFSEYSNLIQNREGKDDDGLLIEETIGQTVSENTQSSHRPPKKKPRRPWNERYLRTFPWIQYDAEKQEASCILPQCGAYNSLE
jgi:hypothetical protein